MGKKNDCNPKRYTELITQFTIEYIRQQLIDEHLYNADLLERDLIPDQKRRYEEFRKDGKIRTADLAFRCLKHYESILHELKGENTSAPLTTYREDQPQNLVGLFGGSQALMNACIDVLKELDPPQLSDQNTWIGTDKNIFVLWQNKLLKKSIIEKRSKELMAVLLNKEIKDLNIKPSTFEKYPTRSKRNFDADLDVLISKLSKVERTES